MSNKLFYFFLIGLIGFQIYSRMFGHIFGKIIELLDDITFVALYVFTIFLIFRINVFKGKTYLLILMSFIMLILFSSILNSVPFDIVLLQTRSYILFCIMYFFILNSSLTNYQIMKIVQWTVIFTIPVAMSSWYEYLFHTTLLITEDRYGKELIQENIFRTFTLIGNPIDYANFIIIVVAILMAATISKYPLFSKKYLFLLLIFFSLTLFFANSRGPILAILMAIVLLTIWFRLIKLKYFLIIIFITFGIITFMGDTLLSRLGQLSPENMSEDGYRMLFLFKSFEVFADNPFFGVGPGRFGGWVSINYSTSPVYDIYNFSTDKISSIDMFWPHLLGELGLIGFIIYLMLYVIPFVQFTRVNHAFIHSQESFFVALVIKLIIIELLMIGFFSISLETQLIQSVYFIILGLCVKYFDNLKLSKVNTC